MSQADLLQRECRVFCRYLVGTEPTDYVSKSYAEAHTAPALSRRITGMDRVLLRVARRGRWGASLADAYAALFARTGVLRSKLVLLFGILESTAPYHEELGRTPRGGIFRLMSLGVIGALTGLLAVVCFGPVHLLVGRGDA